MGLPQFQLLIDHRMRMGHIYNSDRREYPVA